MTVLQIAEGAFFVTPYSEVTIAPAFTLVLEEPAYDEGEEESADPE